MRLLLATHNAGKRAELCALLSHIPGITLLTAHEQPIVLAIPMPASCA